VTLHVALHGASGRMGRAVAAAAESEGASIAQAFASPGDRDLDRDAGELAQIGAIGVRVLALAQIRADVAVDFSAPDAIPALAARCRDACVPLVSGTTGLDAQHIRALDELAEVVPVVHAPNMSVGVTILFHLAEIAASLAGEDFDAEIVEMHHRAKVDAPSGTALRLLERVAKARGVDPKDAAVFGRSGQVGARKAGEIGVMTLRGGGVVGDHTLVLASMGERLELSHRAHDRSIFARGALRAARWIVGKPPGRYGMKDVIGIA
jgi:4-hydroxy-tetrahydrodipicolinate reductase